MRSAGRTESGGMRSAGRTESKGASVGLIWAQSHSGVIGRDGAIPWRLPEDLARFKELTWGCTVVMGRRTWESLPAGVRPLPGRRNIVMSRDPGYQADGATVVGELADAMTDAHTWVIGGAQVYQLALGWATRCEVTEVDADVQRSTGDVLAPVLDDSWTATVGDWCTSRSGLRYRFCCYVRVGP